MHTESIDRPARVSIVVIGLWIAQVLLAVLFAFAGTLKLVTPLDELGYPFFLPGVFVRFIGVCEVLGALGLILPSLLRIRPALTPIAAAGLAVIMLGAAMYTPPEMLVMALIPGLIGVVAGLVAYGRWRIAPQTDRGQRTLREPALLHASATRQAA